MKKTDTDPDLINHQPLGRQWLNKLSQVMNVPKGKEMGNVNWVGRVRKGLPSFFLLLAASYWNLVSIPRLGLT